MTKLNIRAFRPTIAAATAWMLLSAPMLPAADRLWNSDIQRDLLPEKPKADAAAPRVEKPTAPDSATKRFDFELPSERPMLLLPSRVIGTKADERKEEEKRDLKRNWMFVDPEKAAQMASGAEEEEKEPDAEEALLPYKGVMQQFIEGGSSGSQQAGTGEGESTRESPARDSRSSGISADGNLGSGFDEFGSRRGGSAADTLSRFNQTGSTSTGTTSSQSFPPPPGASVGALPPATGGLGFGATSALGGTSGTSASGEEERQQRSQQFQQLLRGSAFSSQSAGGFGSAPQAGGFRDYKSGPPRSSSLSAPGGFTSSPASPGVLQVPGAGRGFSAPFGSPSLVSPRPLSPALSTIPSYDSPSSQRSMPTFAPAILPQPKRTF